MTRRQRTSPIALVLVVMALACGRTELDLSGDDGSAGGASGIGGRAGAGASGGSAGGGGGMSGGGSGGRAGGSGGTSAGGRGGAAGGAAGTTAGGRGGAAGGTAGMSAGGRGGVGGSGTAGTAGSGPGGRGGAGRGGAGAGGRGTAGAPGGTGGRAGAGGAGGAQPIACGQASCAPGLETCCVGPSGPVCTDAQTPCGGFGLGCVDGSSCAAGQFCCFTLLGRGSLCESAAVCSASLGTVVCSSNVQCPSTAPNCCRIANTGFCSAQACP
jgi:hypothetical protein